MIYVTLFCNDVIAFWKTVPVLRDDNNKQYVIAPEANWKRKGHQDQEDSQSLFAFIELIFGNLSIF